MSDGDQTAYGKTNHTMDTEEVLYHYIISLPFSFRDYYFFLLSLILLFRPKLLVFSFLFFLIRETTLRSSTSIFFNYLKKKRKISSSLLTSELWFERKAWIKIIRKHDIRRSIFSYSRGLSRCDCDFDDKFKKIFLPVFFLYFLFYFFLSLSIEKVVESVEFVRIRRWMTSRA